MRIIHGTPMARTNYVIWAMKELDVEYENNPVSPFKGETRSPEYLKLNPNGLIPTLQEGDFILWESMAINLYLAKNYGEGKLWTDNPLDEAKIMQWSFFAAINLDKHATNCILHKYVLPDHMKNPETLEAAEEALVPHLKVLDQEMADKDYVVDNRFTIADLNMAAILDYARQARYDFSPYPHVANWLDRCLGRPARVEMNASE